MNKNPRLVAALIWQLEKECALYERYNKVLEQQRSALTKFNSEMMDALNGKRTKIQDDMKVYEEKRFKLLSELPRGRERRLTVLVQEHFSGPEQQKLLTLAKRLKSLILSSRAESQEYGMVNQFALNVVNGSLSIILQGSQNVTKRYSQGGAITESYSPTHSRQETVLRQA